MKSHLTIHFKKINHFTVNKTLLEKEPKLIDATKKTLELVCKNLEKYFNDHKIKTEVNFTLEENEE
jgi:hypothetical protein